MSLKTNFSHDEWKLSKGTPALIGEAKEYQNWALSVAKNVAEAAKEGGFLGFGSELVSEKEKSLIAQIESAFNA